MKSIITKWLLTISLIYKNKIILVVPLPLINKVITFTKTTKMTNKPIFKYGKKHLNTLLRPQNNNDHHLK